jgi:hypothetical protein
MDAYHKGAAVGASAHNGCSGVYWQRPDKLWRVNDPANPSAWSGIAEPRHAWRWRPYRPRFQDRYIQDR